MVTWLLLLVAFSGGIDDALKVGGAIPALGGAIAAAALPMCGI